MIDYTSEEFRRSVAEAAAWCASQSLNTNVEEVQKRRALVERANRLWQEGIGHANSGLFRRSLSETKEYREAMALLKQVRDSLGPLERALRSAVLQPDLASLEKGTDAAWAEAVAHITANRSKLVGSVSLERPEINSGRLLLYWPRENLADGGAEAGLTGSSTPIMFRPGISG
jgi:hypothetical protein